MFDYGKQFTIYGSEEMHSSLDKAIELLGLGRNALRKIPVNSRYEINVEALENKIKTDREFGLIPFCIIGNAGTVNTGAVDDLHTLADICRKENMWFHVDGAFGALTKLTPNFQNLVNGLERADSLAFDLHKWMYIQYEAGAVLIKNQQLHREAFTLTADYLALSSRGVHGSKTWFNDYGIQLSRGFKALKVWMSLKEHGIEKYGKVIEQNIYQARYLTKLIAQNDKLELLAPTAMNIVCFRYKSGIKDDEILNRLNEEILIQLHEKAIAVPSYTRLKGKYAIRVAITNHRSTRVDFEAVIEGVLNLGKLLENQI